MSRRLTALVTIVAGAALLAGCGGNDASSTQPEESSGDEASTPSAEPTPSQVTPITFADVPGKDIVYTDMGERIGVRVKPIEAKWSAQTGDVPAPPGSHHVEVYVALTPELPDRGVQGVTLGDLVLRYTAKSGQCTNAQVLQVDGKSYCYHGAVFGSDTVPMIDPEWRTRTWTQLEVMGADLQPGEEVVGMAAFQVLDGVEPTDVGVCAPTREATMDMARFPCVPVETPARAAQ